MSIDDMILINQLAQGIFVIDQGEAWFSALNVKLKRETLREIVFMILNASPRPEDTTAAITLSRLKTTFTPCVLLSNTNLKVGLGKMVNLPDNELPKAFRLLIAMLGVADKRRREMKPVDIVNHWWHRDLGNPQVVEEIRKQYG